ncbi:MAG: sterol desaturase family protein [Candidatus Eisenbacteria bacterium]
MTSTGPHGASHSMTINPGFDLVGGALLAVVFAILLIIESLAPLRQRVVARLRSLRTNLAVAAIGTVALRLLLVPVVLAVATLAEQHDFGLLRLVALPGAVEILAGFVLFDYTIYLWHRATHGVPFLWRFHRVHHSDLDLDVSTAFRFHAGELVLSIPVRAAQVALLGLSPALALAYEIAFELATEFHHSNWRLPFGLERRLHWGLVTPRMHGLHHSIVERETNANWGVVFAWWDRLHGTLRLGVPQNEVVIGLPAHRDPALSLGALLALPFGVQVPAFVLPDGRPAERDEPAERGRIQA